MDSYQLSCKYYIFIENGNIKGSHLPDHVHFENNVLKVENGEPVEIQIIYQLDQECSMKVKYDICKHCQIDIVETKNLSNKAKLHKDVYIDEEAIVHIFSENACKNDELVECYENVYLQSQAVCQCGYAELSDGSYEGIYHYYLDGEGAQATLRMAALSKEKEKKHYEVLIRHNKPHTFGQMDNYGVVKDGGKLVIDGIGTITKGQHGSASHQVNKIMVFDSQCIASANPYLYIDEYDVKASHAAGVGKMDEDHLYYLQSRGLTKLQAMQLITYGYLRPVVDVIDNSMIKKQFENVLLKVGA